MPMTRKKAGGSYGSQGWGLPGAYKTRGDGSEKHVREGRPQAGSGPRAVGSVAAIQAGAGSRPRGDEPPPGSRRKAPPYSAKSALPQRLARGPMTNCVRCTASGRSSPSLSLASLLCLRLRLPVCVLVCVSLAASLRLRASVTGSVPPTTELKLACGHQDML